MNADAARDVVERIARESYGRLVALLVARMRDVPSAEDFLAEAFAAALEQWPTRGVPANPDGWLVTVAQRRHLDMLRSGQVQIKASRICRCSRPRSKTPRKRRRSCLIGDSH